jgi:hypothetical protein
MQLSPVTSASQRPPLFRILYMFVVMEHASRRMIHVNATAHPNAAWTLQQMREAMRSDHTYRFILRDHDAIFSLGFNESVASFGLRVVKTPVHSLQARKVNRDTAARVSGLDHTIDRGPSATNSVVVATALQSRPTTYFVRTRSSRST